jgi:hypothetical protein
MKEHIRARTRGEITSRCSGPGGRRDPCRSQLGRASARPLNVGPLGFNINEKTLRWPCCKDAVRDQHNFGQDVPPGEKGRNNEYVLGAFLNENLPKRYSVSTGKVIAAGGQESGQIDLIVDDRLYAPALLEARAWSLVPIESVYAIISVKTTLNKDELRDAMSSIASVRALPRKAAIRCETNHKIVLREEDTLRPRGVVFAFKSSCTNQDSAQNSFKDVLKETEDPIRPNAICMLDQCLLIRRPFTTETILFKEHALLHFFMFLVSSMDTFPRYQVDLKKYFEEDYGELHNNRA